MNRARFAIALLPLLLIHVAPVGAGLEAAPSGQRAGGPDWCNVYLRWQAGSLGAEFDIADLVEQFGGPHWYTVHLQGQRAGYLRWQAMSVDTGNGARLRVEECSKVAFAIDGRAQQIASRQVTDYDENLRVQRLELWQNLMGRISETTVVVDADKLHIMVKQPDGTHSREMPRPDDFGSEILVTLAAAAGEIGPGWQSVFSAFDPYIGQLDTYTVSFVRQEETAEGTMTLLHTRIKKMGITVQTWLGPDGAIVRQSLPELMGLEVTKATEEEALAKIAGPAFSSGISVGIPPRDPHKSDQVSLIASAAAGSVTDMIPASDRQQVIARPDGSAEVITGLEPPPTQVTQLPISDPELASYLEPNEITQSDSDTIRKLAHSVVGQERDAWTCARALLDWVHNNLKRVKSEPRPISALEVLQQGEGDCSEHAVLLAALAKAAGIPPRIVIGLVYTNGAYSYHEWNELYVGEWVQMDPSWGRYTIGAGHVRLAGGPADREAMLNNNLAAGRTIGTLFLKFNPQQPQDSN